MRNEFTAIYELDDSGDEPRYIAYCIEVTGANAEGKTMDEAGESGRGDKTRAAGPT